MAVHGLKRKVKKKKKDLYLTCESLIGSVYAIKRERERWGGGGGGGGGTKKTKKPRKPPPKKKQTKKGSIKLAISVLGETKRQKTTTTPNKQTNKQTRSY